MVNIITAGAALVALVYVIHFCVKDTTCKRSRRLP